MHHSGRIQIILGPAGLKGSAHPAEVPFGVKALSSFEDQGVCLAPVTTALDDEVPTAAYGPRRSSRMRAVRQGSGGLPTPILRLPLRPSSAVGGRRRPPHGDIGGGILVVSWQRNIFSRSCVVDYLCHTVVPLDS